MILCGLKNQITSPRAGLIERIPEVFNVRISSNGCKRRKALFPELFTAWNCLDNVRKEHAHKQETKPATQGLVSNIVCSFVNNKGAHNAKRLFS